MKLRITLMLAGLLVFVAAMAQTQLTWRFANVNVINAGTQLQFDVQVKGSDAATYHRDLQVYFDYNTAGFGADVVAGGNITVTPLELMDNFYTVVNPGGTDNTSSKVAIITEADNEMTQSGSASHFNLMPDTYIGLLQVTMDIISNTETAGIAFDEDLMNGGQYYQSTSSTDPVKYTDPCLYENNLSTYTLSALYGNITYDNTANTPLSGCTLTLKQGATVIGTATTDVNGDYSFGGVADGSYTIESDCSLPRGGTGLFDIVYSRQFLLGQVTLTTLQQKSADVDAGGSLGLFDLVQMRQFLLGQITGWAQTDWVFEIQSVTVSSGIGSVSYVGLCSGDPDGSHTP